ncbi:GRIP and coiled-coil domain-containing protein 2-like isoform X2 [Watersipora subatra]|uniref:GRIP and coiled-coil domain-containing protein 2-like isoform X2 n=1 Tax=Watersipora subatra TaxID=2589382 RepID=UPI00355C8CCA
MQGIDRMSQDDLMKEALLINEQELHRMYQHTAEVEKANDELRMELGGLEIKLEAYTERLKKANLLNKPSPDSEQSVEASTDEAAPSPESPVDARPKVRAIDSVQLPPPFVARASQTDETLNELEDEAIKGLRETITSLRDELQSCAEVSTELATLKNDRSEEGIRLQESNQQLSAARASMREKDAEIDYLLAVIQRNKSRIEQQSKNIEELDTQLNKLGFQEKYEVQIGDTHHAKLEASLSAAYIDLQKSNDERDSLQTELDDLRRRLSSEQSLVHGMQEDLTTQPDVSREELVQLNHKLDESTKELEILKKQNQLLTADYNEVKTKYESLTRLQEDTFSQKECLIAQLDQLSNEQRKDSEMAQSDLAEQLSRYKKLYEDTLACQEQLQQEIADHSAQHQEIIKNNSMLSKDAEDAKLSFSQCQTEREGHLQTIADLEEVVKQFKEEQSMLNDQFLINQAMNESLKRDIEQVKAELTTNQKKTEAMVGDKTIGEWHTEKEASDKLIEQLRHQESESQKDLANLKGKLVKTQADLCSMHEQAKIANENLEKRYDNQIQELRIEKETFTKKKVELEKTIQDISAQLSAQGNENDELQQQIEGLMRENEAHVGQLNEELDNCRLANENLQLLSASACSELDSLKSLAHKEKEAHEQLTVTLKAEIDAFSRSVEELQQKNQEYVSQLESRVLENNQLSNQVIELRGNLEQTKNELQTNTSSYQTSAAEEMQETVAKYEAKIKEVEEKAGKFKILALKAKKELQETKAQAEHSQVERLKTEHKDESANQVGEIQTLITNYQRLQENFDRLQDDLDDEKTKVSTLRGQLEAEHASKAQLQTQVSALQEEIERHLASNSQLQAKIKAFEMQQTEWNTTVQSLEKESDTKQMETLELNKEILRLTEQMNLSANSSRSLEEKLRAKINELELKVHEARDELEQANKTLNKSSVMDLEIADFERTVSTLEAEVKDKLEVISNLQQELEHEKQKLASMEQQLASADEQRESVESRHEKLQQLLNKTKEELESARQQETETKSTDLAVRGELETLRQGYENLKVELAKMSASKLAAEGKLKSSQDAQQRLMRSMENKQRALQSDLEASRKENTVLQEDYDGYKVRVHSVLKQQQTRASVEAALESEKVEKEHLQEVLGQVKVKLQETSDKLTAAFSENGLLQDELDKLSLKHNKLSQEVINKEAVWRQRLDQLMLENSTISAEHSSSVAQMTQHTEIMTQTFKDQMQTSQSEHEQQVAALTSRIEKVEAERNSLMLDLQSTRQQLGNSKPDQVTPHRPHAAQAAMVQSSSSDVKYKVRESGEGMEHPNPSQINSSQATHSHVSSNTLVGLEQLLTSPDDDASSIVSLGSTQTGESGEEAKLKVRLHLSEKQLEHLRELLNDSEATCLRYNEQVKLLKQEIRRLESNQQRENAISNMEYLKNIVYKFVTLESGDERGRLLPVLNTMLKFNEEELSTMKRIAFSGTDSEAAGDAQSQSSWSGYLHRWTGFSS